METTTKIAQKSVRRNRSLTTPSTWASGVASSTYQCLPNTLTSCTAIRDGARVRVPTVNDWGTARTPLSLVPGPEVSAEIWLEIVESIVPPIWSDADAAMTVIFSSSRNAEVSSDWLTSSKKRLAVGRTGTVATSKKSRV